MRLNTEHLNEWTPNEVVHMMLLHTGKESPYGGVSNLDRLYRKGFLSGGVPTDLAVKYLNTIFDTAVVVKDDEDDLAERFRELFPKQIMSGGYPVRGNLPDIKTKLKLFKKKYPYTDEEILNATKEYVNQMARNNYQYMTISHYLIMKDGTSKLADLIDKYKANPISDDGGRWGHTV